MASTEHTGHVFISYRQTEPDKQFAHKLAYDLQAAGHPVWIDVEGIEAGQTWNTEIQRALDACYAYVVVLSPEALKSQWVRNELLYALREKAGTIFPVLLVDVKLPPEIIAIQYVDFRDNYSKALTELLSNLPVPPSDTGSPSARQVMRLPDEPPKRRLPIWMGVLAGLVVLGLIIGIGALISNGQNAATPQPSPSAAITETATAASTDSPTPTPSETPPPTSSAPLGSPDNPIIFVFFADPATSGQALKYSETITGKLSEMTGLTITSNVETKLSKIVGQLCTRQIHMSTLTTLSYLWAKERDCAVVAAAALRGGESTYYASQIIARAGTESVTSLKGKTFCRVDENSPSGWIMPSLLLKSNGVDPDKDLGSIKNLLKPTEVVKAIYNNECDGGGTFSDARTDQALLAVLPDVTTKVKFLVKTPEIPNDSIVFRPDVPEDTRALITDKLIEMFDDKDIYNIMFDMNNWTGLKKVDDSAYKYFRQFFSSTGYSYEQFVK